MKKNKSAIKNKLVGSGYLLPFVLVTSLFFLWGFSRSVLDVLNKHFQEVLHVSIADSMLIQASTYLAYALMAIPSGILISRYGYRRGLVAGLSVFAAGCFMFIPGASSGSFPLFLIALFVIGCGLAALETSANPYVAELGSCDTSASRLNLAQSFNGLGCMLGPVMIGGMLFSDTHVSVAVPYTVMGVLVLVIAAVFAKVRLTEIQASETGNPGSEEKAGGFGFASKKLWHSPAFAGGVLTLFCYEIAEIGINSLFINFTTAEAGLGKIEATMVLSFGALAIFMLARVAGSVVMRRIKARKVLLVCGIGASLAALATSLLPGKWTLVSLLMCYAFEAIMFPTVFAMVISRSGKYAKTASSYMMMTPLGGAVGAWLMGAIAGSGHLSAAFLIPAAAYLPVVCYTLKSHG